MAVIVLDELKISQTSNGKSIHEIAFGPFDFHDTIFFVHDNNTNKKTKYLICLTLLFVMP